MALNSDIRVESDPLPNSYDPQAEAEDTEQIMQELRQTRSEQAVAKRRNRKLTLDKTTFGITGALALAFVAWGFLGRDSLASTSTMALDWVMEYTGWLFMVLASLFVAFVLWLALGKWGNIPLGKDGEKPEFRTISWISMMFAAGMGIGLMFYGVAEPLYHYISPPPGTVDGRTPAAIQTAMATSIFHWTLHPWAMYAVVGIAMAYGTYRLGRRQLISAAFTSLFGIRTVEGPVGKFINILAIFATLFGTAASLGLGALQIGSGLTSNGWFGEIGTPVLVAIVAILTACFVASAVSGISRGIQWLSNIDMVLAVLLALIVFVAGPTLFILNLVPCGRRRLCPRPRGNGIRAPRPSATRPCAHGCPAGPSSTGHGGCPGHPSWACSLPGSAAGAPSASSLQASCWYPASSASSGSGSSAEPPSMSSRRPTRRTSPAW